MFGCSSLAGDEPDDDVPLEDEARLLSEPSNAPSVRSEEGSFHSEMEVEAPSSLASEAVQASSYAPPSSLVVPPPAAAAPDAATAAILVEMAQMQESFRQSQESFQKSLREIKEDSAKTTADLRSRIHELESGSQAEIPGLPLSQCPPTSSGNPWCPGGKWAHRTGHVQAELPDVDQA